MLLVGHGRLITRDDRLPIIEDGCVAITDGLIAEVGTTTDVRQKYRDAEFIDAHGHLIMPGLINTHMHLYSTFARGMALKDEAPANFQQILERLWWRLDKVLDLDDVYYSAMVPLIDCIKNGTTTIFDHHSSPGAVRGSLFRIAEAVATTGVRSCLAYEVSDRDGEQVASESIEENREFRKHCNKSPNENLKALFGLHASFTLSDKTLARCVEVAEECGSGFHVHTAEGPGDLAQCEREHGKRIVQRFHDLGLLGANTIAAHCVHVDDKEIDLLRTSKTNVVHNPESNMGNAVGCAPVLKMLKRGVRVGLGTDGYTCDMFESLKVANVLHKHQTHDPSAAWVEPPSMLFERNAKIASECFGGMVGTLVPGAHADVIVVDYDPPTPMCASNLNGHMLFGLSGRAVEATIVGGKVLMRDRELLVVDEKEVMANARDCAARLWQRF